MKSGYAKRERGAALLALLAVIMLGASWFLVSQLNAESGMASAVRKARNAEVLNRAKLALIGYVAMQAAEAGENNPGRLACPEAAGNIGGTNEGVAAGNCTTLTLPAIGRFPWRTFGMDELADANSEPLWYVVSPGWALSNSTTPPLTTYINSNSNGQLLVNARSVSTLSQTAGLATAVSTAHGFRTGDIVKTSGAVPAGYNVAAPVTVVNANTFTYSVDSTLSTPATGSIKAGNAAVALIIAPGPAMQVASSAGCAARNQLRSVPSSTINALDYLECYDAANGVFSTTGPSGSFNDQVLIITAADVLPSIEATIANRIEREIAPALKTVYTPATWGFSGSNPVFPFAAPFSNPGSGAGTSNYRGAPGTYQGLLPFNQTQGCTESASDLRCTTATTGATAFLVFSKSGSDIQTGGLGSIRTQSTCSWQSDVYVCTGLYSLPSISVRVRINVTNVAMGLRALDPTKVTCTAVDDAGGGLPTQNVGCSAVTAALQSDGSAILTVTTNALSDIASSGWNTVANYKINIDRAAFGDHALLSSADSTTGWFVRNEWYRLVYYAVAQGHTAGTLPPTCTTGTNCLSVANVIPVNAQHAILILAGRSINGTARPSSTLANYLEFGNATAPPFERQPVSLAVDAASKRPFNDRIVVVGSN